MPRVPFTRATAAAMARRSWERRRSERANAASLQSAAIIPLSKHPKIPDSAEGGSLDRRSTEVRRNLSEGLLAQSVALMKSCGKSKAKEWLDLAESLARTAKLVFDWGATRPVGLILIGSAEKLYERQECKQGEQSSVIDVQEVNKPSCGPDTPTGSVPSGITETFNTQSEQVPPQQQVTPESH